MNGELKCPNCGASASLPLGMTCSDHRPVIVGADCGHNCCDTRTDPFHDHFLDPEECCGAAATVVAVEP